jgi:hypothetical protein
MQHFFCTRHISTRHRDLVFFGLNNSILDLCINTMTCKINRGTSINGTQEQVSTTLYAFFWMILRRLNFIRQRIIPEESIRYSEHGKFLNQEQNNVVSSLHFFFLPQWLSLFIFKILFGIVYANCGPGSSVGLATDYGLDGSGIEFQWGRDFSHTSRPAPGPTQPPVHWVPGLSRG